MTKNDYLKILSRFLKEENAYYLMPNIKFHKHMENLDSFTNIGKDDHFFNIFNKYCNWRDSKEGYEFYYSLTLKLILFCYKHHKEKFSELSLKTSAKRFKDFSSYYKNRDYYQEINNLIYQ